MTLNLRPPESPRGFAPRKQGATTIKFAAANPTKIPPILNFLRRQKNAASTARPAAYWTRKCEVISHGHPMPPRKAVTVKTETSAPNETSKPSKLTLAERNSFMLKRRRPQYISSVQGVYPGCRPVRGAAIFSHFSDTSPIGDSSFVIRAIYRTQPPPTD